MVSSSSSSLPDSCRNEGGGNGIINEKRSSALASTLGRRNNDEWTFCAHRPIGRSRLVVIIFFQSHSLVVGDKISLVPLLTLKKGEDSQRQWRDVRRNASSSVVRLPQLEGHNKGESLLDIDADDKHPPLGVE